MSRNEPPPRKEPDQDRPIRIRPRAPKVKNEPAWPVGLRHVLRLARNTVKRANSGKRSTTRQWNQRCAVRVTYSPNQTRGQWAAHGRYVVRERATTKDGETKAGFNATEQGVDPTALAAEWQTAGDPRMFKLIVSPEFGERLDLKTLAQRLMTSMEADLGVKLEWVGVAHFNTEHPHVHVLLRGMADGQGLRMPKDYIRHGIREHAEALCTAQLGYRTDLDRTEAARREIDQPRLTTIDTPLRRQNTPENDSTWSADHFVADVPPNDKFLPHRLRVLQSMGLAEPASGPSWHVRKDFEAVLHAMSLASDRQRMLTRCAAVASDPGLPIQFTPVTQIHHLEGRVLGHVLDERSDQTHMLLEGTDHRIHVIPHDATLSAARHQGLLKANQTARLRVCNGRTHVETATGKLGR